MDSIVNKLTEIEDAASAVVQHAEDQKSRLEKEYEEKRRTFDEELEKKTSARLESIRTELDKNTSDILEGQNGASEQTILALRKEYEEKHTEYAHEILRRITEV